MDEQTIYEYAGGADAFRRLAEHLAAWLSEVFGGPDTYTREYGGHGALLRHHANRSITEPMRLRFIEAFEESADEVGLPDDERFRKRLHEYLEWGTRIAVAVSQPGVDVTTDQPVPRWGWS